MHVGIAGGRIAALIDASEPPPDAATVIDATGLLVMPGAIDGHTHFTLAMHDVDHEIEAGSRGAAATGVTTVVEMPHSEPPATTLDAFLAKKARFDRCSVIDFALWGGIDGATLGELPRMAAAGAAAFKGFMCSGDPTGKAPAGGLPALDDDTLLTAMQQVKAVDGVVGLHAENHAIIHGRMAALKAAGRRDARAHAEAGPEIAEIEAVARAILFARETGVRLHIVHISSARAAAIIRDAKRDVRLTVETCPQYLMLDEDDLARIGNNARCGPPIRSASTVTALWKATLAGEIDMLASDHCPYRPEQKAGDEIWVAAMGLTGIETAVPTFFSAAVNARGMALTEFARMTASAPAKLYGLYPGKGEIAVGFDADLVLYDPERTWRVSSASFRGAAKWSVFDGLECRGRVVRTIVHGTTVFAEGHDFAAAGSGRFIARAARVG
jgi:allantoinase